MQTPRFAIGRPLRVPLYTDAAGIGARYHLVTNVSGDIDVTVIAPASVDAIAADHGVVLPATGSATAHFQASTGDQT